MATAAVATTTSRGHLGSRDVPTASSENDSTSKDGAPGGMSPPGASAESSVRPFLIGTAIGGVTGAVAGTLLSQSTRRLLVGLIHLATRRLTDDERDELRFELLLQ